MILRLQGAAKKFTNISLSFCTALDVLRLAVRFPSITKLCCSESEGDNLAAKLLSCTR